MSQYCFCCKMIHGPGDHISPVREVVRAAVEEFRELAAGIADEENGKAFPAARIAERIRKLEVK